MDVAWEQVTSKCKRTTEARFSDQTWCVRALIMAIVFEPMRCLYRLHLSASLSNPYYAYESWPTLMDLLNPCASLIEAVQAYYSSLLENPVSMKRIV